jgi:hypothetical protein
MNIERNIMPCLERISMPKTCLERMLNAWHIMKTMYACMEEDMVNHIKLWTFRPPKLELLSLGEIT